MNDLNPVYCHRDKSLEDKRDFIGSTDLFCRVIGNADGVSFQIIYGKKCERFAFRVPRFVFRVPRFVFRVPCFVFRVQRFASSVAG